MISKEEVQHIAKLARLELSENEVEKMQKDLSSILDYFNLLKEAPRNHAEINPVKSAESGVSQDAKPFNRVNAESRGKKNELRKDEAMEKSSNVANSLVQAAPDTKDGYFKVKSIL